MNRRKFDVVVCPSCGIPVYFRADVDFSLVRKVRCPMCSRWIGYKRDKTNERMLVARGKLE